MGVDGFMVGWKAVEYALCMSGRVIDYPLGF